LPSGLPYHKKLPREKKPEAGEEKLQLTAANAHVSLTFTPFRKTLETGCRHHPFHTFRNIPPMYAGDKPDTKTEEPQGQKVTDNTQSMVFFLG